MARQAQPWFRRSDGWWYVKIGGKQKKLVQGRKNKDAAVDRWHEIMTERLAFLGLEILRGAAELPHQREKPLLVGFRQLGLVLPRVFFRKSSTTSLNCLATWNRSTTNRLLGSCPQGEQRWKQGWKIRKLGWPQRSRSRTT